MAYQSLYRGQEIDTAVGQVLDKSFILQDTGESSVDTISQKVLTKMLGGLNDRVSINTKELANLKAGISPDFTTDDSTAYTKDVPENALPYASVDMVGGMTYKSKNLIPFPYAHDSKTFNGITYTVNSDGTISLDGTATGDSSFALFNGNMPASGQYTLSGDIGGSVNTYYLQLYGDDIPFKIPSNGSGVVTHQVQRVIQRVVLYVKTGASFNNFIIKPMLNEGSIALPYELYFPGLRDAKVTEIFTAPKIQSWKEVQDIVRAGKASEYFNIRDQLICEKNGTELVWDIIGIDHDIPSDSRFTHSLTLQLHNCYANVQFDATEALFHCEAELPAGTYHFSLLAGYDPTYGGGKTYQFTLTKAVPAGGVIMFPWPYQTQASTIKVSTYATQIATTALETVSVTEGTVGTALETIGTCNHSHRIRYGFGNYNESAIRQWMNSDGAKGTFWVPKTKFDRPPSWNASLDGFLYGMDKSFVDIIGNVKKVTSLNMLTDSTTVNTPDSIETDEKFFLLSNEELYFAKENGVDQGKPYAYYQNYSTLAAPGSGADPNRTKYLNGEARYYWMRSPNPWYASTARLVYPDGSLGSTSAYGSGGAAPACCII